MRKCILSVLLVALVLGVAGLAPVHAQGQTPIKLKFSNFQPLTFSAAPVMAA